MPKKQHALPCLAIWLCCTSAGSAEIQVISGEYRLKAESGCEFIGVPDPNPCEPIDFDETFAIAPTTPTYSEMVAFNASNATIDLQHDPQFINISASVSGRSFFSQPDGQDSFGSASVDGQLVFDVTSPLAIQIDFFGQLQNEPTRNFLSQFILQSDDGSFSVSEACWFSDGFDQVVPYCGLGTPSAGLNDLSEDLHLPQGRYRLDFDTFTGRAAGTSLPGALTLGLNVVPEPSSAAMLLLMSIGILATRRRLR